MTQKSVGMAIFLSILTCGIYGIVWFINLTDDLNSLTQEFNTSGGKAFLFTILTCGIYTFYWNYRMGERLDMLKVQQGYPSSALGFIYLLLSLFGFGIVSMALMQSELNKYATAN